MPADDFFFHHGLTATATEPAEPAEPATAEISAGVDEPEDEEKAGDRAEDDADNDARLRTGVEALINGRDSKYLGLPFRK